MIVHGNALMKGSREYIRLHSFVLFPVKRWEGTSSVTSSTNVINRVFIRFGMFTCVYLSRLRSLHKALLGVDDVTHFLNANVWPLDPIEVVTQGALSSWRRDQQDFHPFWNVDVGPFVLIKVVIEMLLQSSWLLLREEQSVTTARRDQGPSFTYKEFNCY